MNFKHEFSELSLLSQDGFNLRLEANGYAVIEYYKNGNWNIEEIWLEGTRWNAPKFRYDRKHFRLGNDRADNLVMEIGIAIEKFHSHDIQDRIRDELNEAGISIPDPNKEHLEVSAS